MEQPARLLSELDKEVFHLLNNAFKNCHFNFCRSVTLAAAFVKFFIYDFRPSKRFSPAAWRQGNERIRGQMVDSLVTLHLLEGKNSKEVVNLIGRANKEGTNCWRYYVDVGLRFGGSRWKYDLILEFDQNNTVHKTLLLD